MTGTQALSDLKMHHGLQVLFRVDASQSIGTGHVFRCLSLAKKMQAMGAKCIFVTRPHEAQILDSIADMGIYVIPMSAMATPPQVGNHASWLGDPSSDVAEFLALTREFDKSNSIVLTDHYGIDYRWQAELKRDFACMVVIDDLADRRHECDILIDQNLGRNGSDYAGLVPPHCKMYCGPEFALLRDGFADVRHVSLDRRSAQSTIQNVLISLGGVDAENFTQVAMEALRLAAGQSCGLAVDIVLSNIAPHRSAIEKALESYPLPSKLHVGTNRMEELMAQADLAIGAAGSTTLERLVVGLPSLVVANADNQIRLLNLIDAYQVGRYVGWVDKIDASTLAEKVVGLINDTKIWKSMIENAASMCDGLGCTRVADAVLTNAAT